MWQAKTAQQLLWGLKTYPCTGLDGVHPDALQAALCPAAVICCRSAGLATEGGFCLLQLSCCPRTDCITTPHPGHLLQC